MCLNLNLRLTLSGSLGVFEGDQRRCWSAALVDGRQGTESSPRPWSRRGDLGGCPALRAAAAAERSQACDVGRTGHSRLVVSVAPPERPVGPTSLHQSSRPRPENRPPFPLLGSSADSAKKESNFRRREDHCVVASGEFLPRPAILLRDPFSRSRHRRVEWISADDIGSGSAVAERVLELKSAFVGACRMRCYPAPHPVRERVSLGNAECCWRRSRHEDTPSFLRNQFSTGGDDVGGMVLNTL